MPEDQGKIKAKPLRWFRFYTDAVDDPKVQKLPPHVFKVWVNMLCLAARNNGVLPCRDDLAFALRMSDHDATAALDHLIDVGLMDINQGDIEPHNWAGRQFRSDADPTAAERQKRRRKKHVTRDITHESQPPEQSRAETETEKKTPKPPAGAFDDPCNSAGIQVDPVGRITLVNGTRQFWLDEFGGDAHRLDLALRQVSVQPNSRRPLRSQVEAQLARQAAARRDQDARYAAAVKSNPRNKPAPDTLEGHYTAPLPAGPLIPILDEWRSSDA